MRMESIKIKTTMLLAECITKEAGRTEENETCTVIAVHCHNKLSVNTDAMVEPWFAQQQ